MGILSRIFGKQHNENSSAEMGWRYITYRQGMQTITMMIQPMVKGPCLVYAPNEKCWKQYAPSWASNKREDILNYLSSIKWNRYIKFEDVETNFVSKEPVPGALESTQGGETLEAQNLFQPNSSLTPEQAKELWYTVCRRFAEACKGEVNIFRSGIIPGSVFEEIELPALKSNKRVKLKIHEN